MTGSVTAASVRKQQPAHVLRGSASERISEATRCDPRVFLCAAADASWGPPSSTCQAWLAGRLGRFRVKNRPFLYPGPPSPRHAAPRLLRRRGLLLAHLRDRRVSSRACHRVGGRGGRATMPLVAVLLRNRPRPRSEHPPLARPGSGRDRRRSRAPAVSWAASKEPVDTPTVRVLHISDLT